MFDAEKLSDASDCFLYFRLWPGFTDPFPVDRFNGIANDQDLLRALDDYALGELARPEIRLQVKQVASILCGIVSGGVEVIDFDEPTLFGPIYGSLPADLRDQLSIYETPKGWHLIYRCEEIYKATKLARRPDKSTLIETRGEGSYIATEGSPLRVHSSGIPYVHYMGPRLETLASIDPKERREIWRKCIAYDQTGEPTPAVKLGRQLAERSYRQRHPVDSPSIERSRAYLAKMEPAIQGSNGSGACFRAACKLVGDFGLNAESALQLLVDEYNPRCDPPWSERELQHKVADAIRKTVAA